MNYSIEKIFFSKYYPPAYGLGNLCLAAFLV